MSDGAAVNEQLLYVPLIPLVGSALVYLLTAKKIVPARMAGWIATAAAACAFGNALSLFLSLGHEPHAAISAVAWKWFPLGSLNIEMGFRMDHLAAVMTLIVTGVGSLIHLYAIGYMAEDDSQPRFFAYLNLFLFSMLLLVLGDNLLVMFVGWEGVGLCSYLLIGFWYTEMQNAVAGQKAFVVNRIGDAGFLLGIFTLAATVHTLNFVELQEGTRFLSQSTIEFIALCLFVGAMGKSAQVPLYVWLPDAMAGPTPVSALIHAATMVTAGVYMIAKLGFLYALAPYASIFIGCIGAFTAILAASIALVQFDIKKVLAYSTVSQLGYMFMAMGAMAYSNGVYHVVTHAFFKACLFMGAGSVIIGCHHEQDMRMFGGLIKKMPVTGWTYLVATFAIAGFPFLSGYFSKDAILWAVFSEQNPAHRVVLFGGVHLNHLLWAVGFITALMTAFYMTRSLIMTFFGEYSGHAHPHESPWVVTVPLVILAALSAVFGYQYGEGFLHFIEPWTRPDLRAHEHPPVAILLERLSIGVAILGMVIAYVLYKQKPVLASTLAQRFSTLYKTLQNKWWVDELYAALIVRPLRAISNFAFRGIDRVMIDGTVNGTALIVDTNGRATSLLHTGQLSTYLLAMFVGLLFFSLFWLFLG